MIFFIINLINKLKVMNIFLDTVSKVWKIILFDDDKNILKQKDFLVLWNESTLLIEEFDLFLKENLVNYFDLKNLVVVSGPGSFTGIRTTILMINTINFVIWKDITTINYFELFEKYPIVKTSSKRDSFVKLTKESDIEILQNDQILFKLWGINNIYWDLILDWIITNDLVNYEKIIKNITFDNKKIAQAYYIKKPNIS